TKVWRVLRRETNDSTARIVQNATASGVAHHRAMCDCPALFVRLLLLHRDFGADERHRNTQRLLPRIVGGTFGAADRACACRRPAVAPETETAAPLAGRESPVLLLHEHLDPVAAIIDGGHLAFSLHTVSADRVRRRKSDEYIHICISTT